MNAIRIVISFFIAVLIVVSVLGWMWTGTHQPPSQATASHLVLGLAMLAGVVGAVAIWRDGSKIFVGHDGSCPGYRTALLLMPEDRIATVFLANAQNLDTEKWAQRLYDIVAPAVRNAVKEPGKGKTPDPALRKFAGTYNVQPWGGEIAVFPWEDGLATLALPTMEPVKNLVKLKKTGENTFRRIRKDEKLGEEIVFDVGPDGKATRFTRHSNVYPRIP